VELNIYAVPAALTLVLLVAETVFLMVALPETRGKGPAPSRSEDEKDEKAASHPSVKVTQRSPEQRLKTLAALKNLHFMFLGIFSGVEFTLTFLTYDLFDWSNKQNGMLLGSIGVMSALLQGGYVRRALPKVGECMMARRGVSSCAIALILLALLPQFVQSHASLATKLLQGAAACMAFTSATVVNSLTAYASLQCDEGFDKDSGKPIEVHPELAKGKALGNFRSSGQLGRAIGPILACASYWTFGPSVTYGISAVAMLSLSAVVRRIFIHRE
jgi:MFS family permease